MSLGQKEQLDAVLRRGRAGVYLLALLFVGLSPLSMPLRWLAVAVVAVGWALPFLLRERSDRLARAAVIDVGVAWLVWAVTAEPVLPLVLVLWSVASVSLHDDRASAVALVMAAVVGEALKVPAVLVGLERHQILAEIPGFADLADLGPQAGIRILLIVAVHWFLLKVGRMYRGSLTHSSTTAHEHRHLVEQAPVPVLALDEWIVDVANDAGTEILGAEDPQELEGIDLRDFLTEDDADRLEEARSKLRSSALVDDVVFVARSGDLRIVDVTLRSATVEGAERTQLVLTDVTQRAEAHLELSESEALFRGAFSESTIPSVIATVEGKILRINEAFAELLGYAEEEVVGRTWEKLVVRSAGIRVGEFSGDAGDARPASTEARLAAKDGRLIPIQPSTSFIRDQHGEPVRVFIQCNELSAEPAAEEERAGLLAVVDVGNLG